MSNEPHRIELGKFDAEIAEGYEARAAQYRLAAEEADEADRPAILAEAAADEARAARLRERAPHAGQWVDIKPTRNYGDRLAISAARVRDQLTGAGVLRVIDTVAWTLTKLDRAIVGWNVSWWNGAPPPRMPDGMSEERRAAIEEIDEDIGPRLVGAIDAYYESQLRGDDNTKG